MANYLNIVPFILKWEGGKVDDPIDRGGLTNKGITYDTFSALALKVLGKQPTRQIFENLTKEQAALFIKYFFDIATGGNKVNNEQIAFILTNWHWGSGKGGLISFQKMLNQKFGFKLETDGIIGQKTIDAINSINPKLLYNTAVQWRANFFHQIVANDPSQQRFLKGWLNRLEDFKNKYPVTLISIGTLIGLGLLFFLINKNTK